MKNVPSINMPIVKIKTFKNLEGHLIHASHIFHGILVTIQDSAYSLMGLSTSIYGMRMNVKRRREGDRESHTSLGDSELWKPDKLN